MGPSRWNEFPSLAHRSSPARHAPHRALQCRRMGPNTTRSDLEHKATAPHSVGCYVITVSDTRTDDTDTAGRAIVELLTAANHRAVGRTIVRDDAELVRD